MPKSDNGNLSINMTTSRASTLYGRVLRIEQFGHFVERMQGQLDQVVAATEAEMISDARMPGTTRTISRANAFLAMIEKAVEEGVVRQEDGAAWTKAIRAAIERYEAARIAMRDAAEATRDSLNQANDRYQQYLHQIEDAVNQVMGVGSAGGNQ